MSLLEKLTERQQQALLNGSQADRGTRKALARRGLVRPDDLSGFQRVTPTVAGHWLLLEHAQRNNTAEKFKPGDRVVMMVFSFYGGEPTPYLTKFVGTVIAVDPAIEVDLGALHGRAFAAPTMLAHVAEAEAAGLVAARLP